jgi:hypothetical protein
VQVGSTETRVKATVQVTRDGSRPVHGARVRFAGAKAQTGRGGVAVVSTTLETGGYFSAYARKAKRYGISDRVTLNVSQGASKRATLPGRG